MKQCSAGIGHQAVEAKIKGAQLSQSRLWGRHIDRGQALEDSLL